MDPSRMQTIPLVTAVAVRRAVASFLPEGRRGAVKVKWPNDVVVAGGCARAGENVRAGGCTHAAEGARMHAGAGEGLREGADACAAPGSFDKICGISVEQKAGALCLGIGVNVSRPQAAGEPWTQPCAQPARRRNNPTYICDLLADEACPTVAQVRDAALSELAEAYGAWQASGFSSFREEFVRHSALEGLMVSVEVPSEDAPVRGRVEGVSECGHLTVFLEGCSEPCEIAAGSVTMLA